MSTWNREEPLIVLCKTEDIINKKTSPTKEYEYSN